MFHDDKKTVQSSAAVEQYTKKQHACPFSDGKLKNHNKLLKSYCRENIWRMFI